MYCEDMDLGLRLWLGESAVGIAPADVVVEHDYDSSPRARRKWFLLERNRWWTLVCDYPARLLLLVAPALLVAEVALLAVAARGGWLRAKLRAQGAVLRALPELLERRRRVQAGRTVSEREFARRLTAEVDNPNLGGLAGIRMLARGQRAYWAAVVRMLPNASRRGRSSRFM